MQKTPKPRSYTGTTNPAESPREVTNKALARRAAAEGIVLLENDGILPLANGASVALYGTGARHTVIGGTGSGMVNCRGSISIDAGLKNAGFTVTTTQWLDTFDADYDTAKSSWIKRLYDMSEPGNFDSLYRAHASNPLISPKAPPVTPQAGTDASTALYVISRISGEGADRKEEKGDYYLTDDELELLTAITDAYEKRVDPRGKVYYWMAGELITEPEDAMTDIAAVRNNKISITPVTYEMTRTETMDDLDKILCSTGSCNWY